MISFLIIVLIVIISLGYTIIRNLQRIGELEDSLKDRNNSIDELISKVYALKLKLDSVKKALE